MAAVESDLPPSIPHPIPDATDSLHASNAVESNQGPEFADSQPWATDVDTTPLPEVTNLALDNSASALLDASLGSMKPMDITENATTQNTENSPTTGEAVVTTVSPNDVEAHDIPESSTTLDKGATEDSLMGNDANTEETHVSSTEQAPIGLSSHDLSTVATEITTNAALISEASANEDEDVSGSIEIKGDPMPPTNVVEEQVEKPIVGQDATETVSCKPNEELEKEAIAIVAETDSAEKDDKAENHLAAEDAKYKVDEGEAPEGEIASAVEGTLEDKIAMPIETASVEQIPAEEKAEDHSPAEDVLGSDKKESEVGVEKAEFSGAEVGDKVVGSTVDEVYEEAMKVEPDEADERKDEPVELAIGDHSEELEPTESPAEATAVSTLVNETPVATVPAAVENSNPGTSDVETPADPEETLSASAAQNEGGTPEESIVPHPDAGISDPAQAEVEEPASLLQEEVVETSTASANEASSEEIAESHPAAGVEADLIEEPAVPKGEDNVLEVTDNGTEPAVEEDDDIAPESTQHDVAAQEASTEMANEPVVEDIIQQAPQEQSSVEESAAPSETEAAVVEVAADPVSEALVVEESPSLKASVPSEATAEPVVQQVEEANVIEETAEIQKTDVEHEIIAEDIFSDESIEELPVADDQSPVDLAPIQDGEEQHSEKVEEMIGEQTPAVVEVSQGETESIAVEAPATEAEEVLAEDISVETDKAVVEEIPVEAEMAAVEEAPVEAEIAAVEESPVEAETAAVEEIPVEVEMAAVEETPVEAEIAAVEETPVEAETAAVEETPVDAEIAAVEETPLEAEIAAVEETPVEAETAAVEEIHVEAEMAAVEETPVDAEMALADETPAKVEMTVEETPVDAEKPVVEEEKLVVEELPVEAETALEGETPASINADARESELSQPAVEEECPAEVPTATRGEQPHVDAAAVDVRDEVTEGVTEAVSEETIVDSTPLDKDTAEILHESVDISASERDAVEAPAAPVDEKEVAVKQDVEQIGEPEDIQHVPSVGEGEDTVIETAEVSTSVELVPVVEAEPVVEEAGEAAVSDNLAVNTLATGIMEQDTVEAPVVEGKHDLDESKVVTVEESAPYDQLSEAVVSHEMGDTDAVTLEDSPQEAVPYMDDALVSEASEADTTSETIIVPEPIIQKKPDSIAPAVEELDVFLADEAPLLVHDDNKDDKMQLDIPKGETQVEGPRSPWTPSFQVTTIGQGVSLPSEEDIPAHSLDGSEATTAISSEEASTVVHDSSDDVPVKVSQDESEAKDELKSTSSLWTPSYSVHSQGSPNAPYASLKQESPAIADMEAEVEYAVPTVEQSLVHEDAVPSINEKLEPEHLESQPTEVEQAEEVAVETTSVAEEPIAVLENVMPEPPAIQEPSNEVFVEEISIPVPAIQEQGISATPDRVEEGSPKEDQLAPETTPAELQASEPHSAEDGPSLTPPEQQSGSASPSWVPSYSVSRQGSPLPRPVPLPSADISEIRLAPPQTDTSVQEDIHHDMLKDEAGAVTAPTVVVDGAEVVEVEKAQPAEEDRPTTPWTPSYTVTVQGADVLDETVIESLLPSAQSEKGKEPEVRQRRSLSEEMESGAFSPTALIGAGFAGGAAVYAASAALRNSNDGRTSIDVAESQMQQEKPFPTVEIPDGKKHQNASRLDSNDTTHATVARSPETSPISSRKRLESTTSSRLFPGGWFSTSSTIPDERTSLEVAQGEFSGTTQGGLVEESLQSPTSPTVEPITPVREQSSSDKRKWCVIM